MWGENIIPKFISDYEEKIEETNAATYISSETFNLLNQNSVLSKSKALQKSKLNYLNNASNNWQTHPVIWSPFIIVGDKK